MAEVDYVPHRTTFGAARGRWAMGKVAHNAVRCLDLQVTQLRLKVGGGMSALTAACLLLLLLLPCVGRTRCGWRLPNKCANPQWPLPALAGLNSLEGRRIGSKGGGGRNIAGGRASRGRGGEEGRDGSRGGGSGGETPPGISCGTSPGAEVGGTHRCGPCSFKVIM